MSSVRGNVQPVGGAHEEPPPVSSAHGDGRINAQMAVERAPSTKRHADEGYQLSPMPRRRTTPSPRQQQQPHFDLQRMEQQLKQQLQQEQKKSFDEKMAQFELQFHARYGAQQLEHNRILQSKQHELNLAQQVQHNLRNELSTAHAAARDIKCEVESAMHNSEVVAQRRHDQIVDQLRTELVEALSNPKGYGHGIASGDPGLNCPQCPIKDARISEMASQMQEKDFRIEDFVPAAAVGTNSCGRN